MNRSKNPENTNKLCAFIYEKAQNQELDNESLVQVIELSVALLNLRTIADYARENNLSYNGAKNCRDTRIIAGVKFVIDNK